MTRLSLFVFALSLVLGSPSLAQDSTALINSKLTPILVKGTTFPYSSGEYDSVVTRKLSLKTVSRAGNAVTDDDRWFRDNVLPQPVGPLDETWRNVPGETRWGKLKFFRSSGDLHVAIYEEVKPRADAKTEKGMSSIYDKEFNYTAVLFSDDYQPEKLFLLEAFHPGILEMGDAHLVGPILYFDCNYNGYAKIAKRKTGYLVAFDLKKEKVLWTSRSLTSSWRGFIVLHDAVISGYGFTEEKDALFVHNRFTGKRWLKVKLKSAHEYLIPKGDKLYVRTYDMNYVYQVSQKNLKKQ